MSVLEGRIQAALEIASRYGGIDGGHHKQWVIDQMVRALTAHKYEEWIEAQNSDPDYLPWDTGIAP